MSLFIRILLFKKIGSARISSSVIITLDSICDHEFTTYFQKLFILLDIFSRPSLRNYHILFPPKPSILFKTSVFHNAIFWGFKSFFIHDILREWLKVLTCGKAKPPSSILFILIFLLILSGFPHHKKLKSKF